MHEYICNIYDKFYGFTVTIALFGSFLCLLYHISFSEKIFKKKTIICIYCLTFGLILLNIFIPTKEYICMP